jgi:hypothetical protein
MGHPAQVGDRPPPRSSAVVSGSGLQYWPQPTPVKLSYEIPSGRSIGVVQTPDFLILGRHEAGWVECKTQDRLLALCVGNPRRYQWTETRQWRSPPGEDAADSSAWNQRRHLGTGNVKHGPLPPLTLTPDGEQATGNAKPVLSAPDSRSQSRIRPL